MASSNIGSGQAKVVTPGTPFALKTKPTTTTSQDSTACHRIMITALPSNVGVVMVGGSDVLATSGSEKGIALANMTKEQNFPIEIKIEDLSKVFIDAVNAGDGVSFAYEY